MQNRRKFLLQSTLAAGALTILRPFKGFGSIGLPAINVNSSRTLTILHTANLKGQFGAMKNSKLAGFGGLKGVEEAIEKVKAENSNTVLIDAGDLLESGVSWEENESFLSSFSKLGYDAILPGNHDMVNGHKAYTEMIKANGLKAVATNYYNQNVLTDVILPYQIIEKGSITVGIVGLANTTKVTGVNSSSTASNAGLVNKTAAFLKNERNCSLVVCLSHEGFTQKNCKVTDDICFARLLSNVDIVITGSQSEGMYNTQIVRTENNHEVVVSTSGANGSMLGRIDITFNDDNEGVAFDAKQIFVAREMDTASAFKKYASALA